MDPLSGATAFATIVSLFGQYRSERGRGEQADPNDFLAWLVESNHEEIRQALEGNEHAMEGVKELLAEQYTQLMQRLMELDQSFAAMATGSPGFGEIGSALRPESVLSDQAIDLLRQFDSSGATKVLELHTMGGMQLLCMGGDRNNLEYEDTRFIEDDLARLVELGLLRCDFNKKGETLYVFTRSASEFVRRQDS
jgi:hypothetical protein